MSEENVELLRQAAEAWNRRDLQSWLEFLHPEIEWIAGRSRLESGAYRGHSGMRKYMADTDADFDGLGQSAGGIPVDTQYGC